VALAAVAVFTAIPSGGLATGLAGAGFVNALLGAAGSAPKEPLGGDTVLAVMNHMRQTIAMLSSCVDGQQQDVVRALQTLATQVSNDWPAIQLTPPGALLALSNAGVDVLDGQHLFTDGSTG
jgi:hypothetical protein